MNAPRQESGEGAPFPAPRPSAGRRARANPETANPATEAMIRGARHPRPTAPETASAATVPPIGTPDMTTLMAKGASLPSTPRRATERAIGRTTPSPTPVTNRKTANAARLGERPDKRVAALKQATPETTTRFEPRARPILPAAMPPANMPAKTRLPTLPAAALSTDMEPSSRSEGITLP